ncbi:MAG TPA: sensor histidine kinase [Rugosimonospora sp.]|nr:sensor histidine kinase [Rugosimonospora sp.]
MRRWLVDGAIAAGVLAVSLLLAPGAARGQPGARPLDAIAYVLVVAAGAALAARRRYPLGLVGLVGAALLVFAVRDYPGGPLVLAVMVALYTAGTRLDRRRALGVGAVAVVLVAARSVAILHGYGQVSAFNWAAPGWVLACLLAGMVVRARRQAIQAIRDRAELAERTREEQARVRVAEERLRIARDLHDVVGHSFAAVNVQARAAATLLDTDPDGARHALTAIEHTSRDALREIRAALSALRTGAPPPTLDARAVRSLLAPVRAAGLAATGTVDPPPLPTEVGHVLYRVVQESLTNVLRHAHARAVTVSVTRDGNAACVEVHDDGAGSATAGSGGQGLTGMRERVEALGGHLHAGPAAEGGWRVTARLPVPG